MNVLEILSNNKNEGKKFKVINYSEVRDEIYTVGKLPLSSSLYILTQNHEKLNLNSTTCKWDFEEILDSKWGYVF